MNVTVTPFVRRRGFSLLEVLVACGILVISLASIAAILPAAAARLGEATATDRATTMATLAISDLQLRGLASRDLFGTPTSPAAIVVGEGLATAVQPSVFSAAGYSGVTNLFSGTFTVSSGTLMRNSSNAILASPPSAVLNARVDTIRGFFLEDELQYRPAQTGGMPLNMFSGMTSGTGYRTFGPNISWGAVLTPEPWGTLPTAMTAVRASIAIFRKPATAVAMTLRQESGSLFSSAGRSLPGALQRTRLKPCTSVLALPVSAVSGAGTGPQWLDVRSSWTGGTGAQVVNALTSGSAPIFVVFDRSPPPTMLSSGSLTFLTFDNLISTDQKILSVR